MLYIRFSFKKTSRKRMPSFLKVSKQPILLAVVSKKILKKLADFSYILLMPVFLMLAYDCTVVTSWLFLFFFGSRSAPQLLLGCVRQCGSAAECSDTLVTPACRIQCLDLI